MNKPNDLKSLLNALHAELTPQTATAARVVPVDRPEIGLFLDEAEVMSVLLGDDAAAAFEIEKCRKQLVLFASDDMRVRYNAMVDFLGHGFNVINRLDILFIKEQRDGSGT